MDNSILEQGDASPYSCHSTPRNTPTHNAPNKRWTTLYKQKEINRSPSRYTDPNTNISISTLPARQSRRTHTQRNEGREMEPQFYFIKGTATRWTQSQARIAYVDERSSHSISLDGLTDTESTPSSVPTQEPEPSGERNQSWSSRRRNTIITNVAQLVLGLALIQIGIVVTWYRKFVQYENDHVNYVFFASVIFLFCGIYGIVIRLKRLRKTRRHQYGYISLVCLSVVASVFISVVCVRMLIGTVTKTLVMKVVSSLGVTLSSGNVILVALATYYTLFKHRSIKKYRQTHQKAERRPTPCYISIFTILNITHIIIGVCVCELGMVGMIYKSIMNVKSSALFSTVFLSVTFIATGAFGIYCHVRKVLRKNLVWVVCTCMMSAACSAAILIAIVITLTGKFYYSGSEAILAFDYMILSLSSLELIASVSSIFVIAIPTVKQSSHNPPSI